MDDVPDHQKIPRQAQALDDPKLAVELRAHLGTQRIVRGVAGFDAMAAERVQGALFRLAGGRREGREDVTEIGQSEHAALGDLARRSQGGRASVEEGGHLAWRLQPALAIRRQASPDLVDGELFASADEDIVEDARLGRRVANVVGRHHAHAERGGLFADRPLVPGIAHLEVPLQLQEDVVPSERADDRVEVIARRRTAERDQPLRMFRKQRLRRPRRVGFLQPLPRARQQAAEVLVAAPAFD